MPRPIGIVSLGASHRSPSAPPPRRAHVRVAGLARRWPCAAATSWRWVPAGPVRWTSATATSAKRAVWCDPARRSVQAS